MKTVFCDESGFTGENLWQADQPHFVYAAVAISEGDAAEIVESTRKKFFLNAPELHAAQLLRRDKGKMAVKSLVERLVPNSSVMGTLFFTTSVFINSSPIAFILLCWLSRQRRSKRLSNSRKPFELAMYRN